MKEAKRALAARRKALQAAWEAENPDGRAEAARLPRPASAAHRLRGAGGVDAGQQLHAQRLGEGAGRVREAHRQHDRRVGRPLQQRQDRRVPQGHHDLPEGRFLRQVPAGRRVGTDDGGAGQRDGAARRRDPGVRDLLRVLRLHEAGRAAVGADGTAGQVRLVARRVPRGRGRPDPPAGRAGGADPAAREDAQPGRPPQHAGAAAGRRRRDGRRLEDGAREPVHAHRADPLAPEHRRRPGPRGLALRRRVRRGPRRLRRGGCRRQARHRARRQRIRGVDARGGPAGPVGRGQAEGADRVGNLRGPVRRAAAGLPGRRSCRSACRPSV